MEFHCVKTLLVLPDNVDADSGKQIILRVYGVKEIEMKRTEGTIHRLVKFDKTRILRIGKFDVDNTLSENYSSLLSCQRVVSIRDEIECDDGRHLPSFNFNEETSSARLAFLVDPFGGLFKSAVRVRTISVDTDQLAARKRGDRAV